MKTPTLAFRNKHKLFSISFCVLVCTDNPATAAGTFVGAQPAPAIQACIITGGTNKNVTQHCIINPAPPQVILLEPAFEAPVQKGSVFAHRIIVRLPETVDILLVACGDVTRVSAFPWPGGMIISPQSGEVGGCMAMLYENAAAGKWQLEVDTPDAESKFTLSLQAQ